MTLLMLSPIVRVEGAYRFSSIIVLSTDLCCTELTRNTISNCLKLVEKFISGTVYVDMH